MLRKQNSWFSSHVLTTLNRRSRDAESVARRFESRHCDIHRDDLIEDVGGGAVADVPAAGDSGHGDDNGGGGDADPDSKPPGPSASLSEAQLALQRSAFRTTKTGIPGVIFNIPAASFRASCVSADGMPMHLGSFASINAAVVAIKAAYESGVA